MGFDLAKYAAVAIVSPVFASNRKVSVNEIYIQEKTKWQWIICPSGGKRGKVLLPVLRVHSKTQVMSCNQLERLLENVREKGN